MLMRHIIKLFGIVICVACSAREDAPLSKDITLSIVEFRIDENNELLVKTRIENTSSEDVCYTGFKDDNGIIDGSDVVIAIYSQSSGNELFVFDNSPSDPPIGSNARPTKLRISSGEVKYVETQWSLGNSRDYYFQPESAAYPRRYRKDEALVLRSAILLDPCSPSDRVVPGYDIEVYSPRSRSFTF